MYLSPMGLSTMGGTLATASAWRGYIMLTAGLGFSIGFAKDLAGLGSLPMCCSSNLTPLGRMKSLKVRRG